MKNVNRLLESHLTVAAEDVKTVHPAGLAAVVHLAFIRIILTGNARSARSIGRIWSNTARIG